MQDDILPDTVSELAKAWHRARTFRDGGEIARTIYARLVALAKPRELVAIFEEASVTIRALKGSGS